VAQQVSRNILPDLKLAIQEKEPSLAVSLLGIVKDWVANMKKEGEGIQQSYSELQQSVQNLIMNAQHAKRGADRHLTEAVQADVSNAAQVHPMLALDQGSQHQAQHGHGIGTVFSESMAGPPAAVGGGTSVPRARQPVPSADGALQGNRTGAVNSMNLWTRHLFEQLSTSKGSELQDGASDLPMTGGDSDGTPVDAEAWKADVLELLFMAPGVGANSLPKPEAFNHEEFRAQREGRAESQDSTSGPRIGRAETVDDAEDVTMRGEDVQAEESAIVRFVPPAASSGAEAMGQSSASLLRALRELKRVDEILQGCSAFWSNMDGTVQKLAQMKEHTEVLVNYANSSKPLRDRFEQRLTEYTQFWLSLERLCRQYCLDHQTSAKAMHDVIREVSDAADVYDTAQSVRLGVAVAMRRQGGYVGQAR